MRIFLRGLIPFFFLACSFRCLAGNYSLSTGVTYGEKGDNRWNPGFILTSETPLLDTKWFHEEERFYDVTQTYDLLSLGKSFVLPNTLLSAFAGFAWLRERTWIKTETETFYQHADAWGGCLELEAKLLSRSFWSLNLGWTHALFPAGLFAGLLLSTGRKQYLHLDMEVSF